VQECNGINVPRPDPIGFELIKQMNKSLLFFALLSVLMVGCSVNKMSKSAVRLELLDEVRKLSADVEFKRNVAANHIVFYGYGDRIHCYWAPGLSDSEIAEYITTERVPMELRFIDDPAPPGVSEEFWREVARFFEQYNKLMIRYVRENLKGPR
jgi:hypothetical protein